MANSPIFAPLKTETFKVDSVAQLVEHNTFNVGVLGSNPSGITSWDRREIISFVPFLFPNNLLLIRYINLNNSLCLAVRTINSSKVNFSGYIEPINFLFAKRSDLLYILSREVSLISAESSILSISPTLVLLLLKSLILLSRTTISRSASIFTALKSAASISSFSSSSLALVILLFEAVIRSIYCFLLVPVDRCSFLYTSRITSLNNTAASGFNVKSFRCSSNRLLASSALVLKPHSALQW